MKLFEAKIKTEKVLPDGKLKTVTGKYLIDAVNWTEAEARCYKEMEVQERGYFEITSLNPFKFTEMLDTEGDNFFMAKIVSVVTEDGKEKKITNKLLLRSDDVNKAYKEIEDAYDEDSLPHEVEKIEDLKVEDFWKHEA